MRGFNEIKSKDGKSFSSKQNSYDYLIKIEDKTNDRHTKKAKERFNTPPYSIGRRNDE